MDLILLNFHDFDLILGMDWLFTYYDILYCFNKKVTFQILSQPKFNFLGSSLYELFQFIYALKDKPFFRRLPCCPSKFAKQFSNVAHASRFLKSILRYHQ